MIWLIREKMFAYFYNKFRPLNRMYFIKFGVNCSLRTLSLVAAEGLWYLGSLFYHDTRYSQKSYILQIYFCVIFRETRHHAQAHITCGALCSFFGCEMNTETHSGSLSSVCYATSATTCFCCCCFCCCCTSPK
jgi:hypothetical protein